jgi:hypothetical protein
VRRSTCAPSQFPCPLFFWSYCLASWRLRAEVLKTPFQTRPMGGVEAGFPPWMGQKTPPASRGMPFGMRLWEEYITVYNFALYL